MNWRPIRTAPRDGRRVLVWIDDSKQTVAFAKLWFYEDGSLGGGAEGFNGHWQRALTHMRPAEQLLVRAHCGITSLELLQNERPIPSLRQRLN